MVLFLTGYQFRPTCPSKELIKPCVCEDKEYGKDIRCEGKESLDLVKVFGNLDKTLNETEKQFSVFHSSNTAITELKENTFRDITFDEIFIGCCNKLTKIHENAFNGSEFRIKYLSFYNNSALTSPDNSIFKLAGKLVNLRYFELENTNVTKIPSNSFGNLEHLVEIHFAGNFIKEIGAEAFSNLRQLRSLNFEQVNFTSIPDKAFEFKESSNDTMILGFGGSPLVTSKVFTPKSLLGMKRPAIIRFGSNKVTRQITYLDEKVFLPFLFENDKNNIDINGEEFDCNDCRNYWLKTNQKAFNRIKSLKCSDKKLFNDPNHFKNCTS